MMTSTRSTTNNRQMIGRLVRTKKDEVHVITPAHLTFYRQKKAPVPSWAQGIADRESRVTVHQLINAQSGFRERSYVVHNTLNVLSMARRRGNDKLMESLARMAKNPGCTDRPERRAAHCKNWLARILADRLKTKFDAIKSDNNRNL